jgi:hypothetical protein
MVAGDLNSVIVSEDHYLPPIARCHWRGFKHVIGARHKPSPCFFVGGHSYFEKPVINFKCIDHFANAWRGRKIGDGEKKHGYDPEQDRRELEINVG